MLTSFDEQQYSVDARTSQHYLGGEEVKCELGDHENCPNAQICFFFFLFFSYFQEYPSGELHRLVWTVVVMSLPLFGSLRAWIHSVNFWDACKLNFLNLWIFSKLRFVWFLESIHMRRCIKFTGINSYKISVISSFLILLLIIPKNEIILYVSKSFYYTNRNPYRY